MPGQVDLSAHMGLNPRRLAGGVNIYEQAAWLQQAASNL